MMSVVRVVMTVVMGMIMATMIVARRAMVVICIAVRVVPVAVVPVSVPVIIVNWRRRESQLAPLGAEARELQRSGQEHQNHQSGDVNRLLNHGADPQPLYVSRPRVGGDVTPDEDRQKGEEENSDPATLE